MIDKTTHDDSQQAVETDDGVQTVDYLDEPINIFSPATPFMRDNLRTIGILFSTWILLVFGPITATLLEPDFMTGTTVLGGFPLHIFMTVVVAPTGALTLCFLYAFQRDRLDTKYGISHETDADVERTATTDGGEE